ncbi:MAG TPA: glycosyl hydrolase family 18 protein [Bryobacteraceae bacterium]|jgi:chitinase|nr:glycosyl hydrolase family 18 protein [Bryobacteraceae bacterium]
MRTVLACLVGLVSLNAYSSVPTFRYATAGAALTLVGGAPSNGGTTTIPTVVVPISLSFESAQRAVASSVLDATTDVPHLIHSPVFGAFDFPSGKTQYADALLRSTFAAPANWHTVLSKPAVAPTVIVRIPPAYGYLLLSKRTGRSIGIADLWFVQREIFKQVPPKDGTLFLLLTHNTAFYAESDATICCTFGTQGTDSSTGNSFVLASYLEQAPSIVREADVQPVTEHLAEFLYDPLHDPLRPQESKSARPGNTLPAWMRPPSMRPGDQGRCGGSGIATPYFLLEPTDINPKNNFPFSEPFVARVDNASYHLQNVALLPWYLGASPKLSNSFSFPDRHALTEAAKPCPSGPFYSTAAPSAPIAPSATPAPQNQPPNGHKLIGYWTGRGPRGSVFPLREIPPQWDIILVAFASPAKDAPEGTLRFQAPSGINAAQLKSDIAYLKSRGKTIMISLGGGGEYFTLADAKHISNFVSSVAQIVSEYQFEGVDIDFETPSLVIDPGDTDFRHPTTPSIVNLIAGLRQLRERFGPGFKISLVPEGPQIPAGYPTYGGQFGSYLPLVYALRDILTFVDVQDYNTPPLQGLDGEIYQAGSVDYHAAMTELLLRGFPVGRDGGKVFPGLPADKVAIGFLTGDATPEIVSQALAYVITGKAPAGASYRLQQYGGYPHMIGAMFWTIDDDRIEDFRFSNVIGPQLHSLR